MTGARPVPGAGVFISYRREDAASAAGWLFDRLAEQFGRGRVFKDVDSIRPGANFAAEIMTAIGSSAVLLAVIGPQWLTAAGPGGRRLDEPADLVRLEIEEAFTRNVPVIPVLVDEAYMPSALALPASLAELAKLQAVELRAARFKADTDHLIGILKPALRGASRRGPLSAGRRWRNLLLLAGALLAALAVSLALVFVPGSSRTDRSRTTARTGPSPMAVLQGRVQSVAFSPNGAVVAAGTSSGHVDEWGVGTHRLLDTVTDPRSHGVNDIAFSYDNALLATADANGKAYLWDGSTLVQKLTDPAGSSVLSVAFSSDKGFLAIGDADGNVWVCAMTEDRCGKFDLRGDPEIDPDSDGVTSLAFNYTLPRNTVLAAGDGNGKVFMWIHSIGATFDVPSGSAIRSVTITPGNEYLVAGAAAGQVYEWWYYSSGRKVETRKDPVVSVKDPGSMGVESVSVSSEGQYIAAADANHHVYLWHGGTLVRPDFTDPSGSSVLSVAFDDLSSVESGHVSELLAIGDASGRVYLWPVASDLVGG